MSTLDLINAIDSGKSTEIESSFNEIFASKVSAAIDAKRLDIAGNLFKVQEAEQLEEEQLDENLEKWKQSVRDNHGEDVTFKKSKHLDSNTYHTTAHTAKGTYIGNYHHGDKAGYTNGKKGKYHFTGNYGSKE